jgi:hypothetical protein
VSAALKTAVPHIFPDSQFGSQWPCDWVGRFRIGLLLVCCWFGFGFGFGFGFRAASVLLQTSSSPGFSRAPVQLRSSSGPAPVQSRSSPSPASHRAFSLFSSAGPSCLNGCSHHLRRMSHFKLRHLNVIANIPWGK